MDEGKLELLRGLGTKDLMERMHELENALEKAMHEENNLKGTNTGYLASHGSDCSEVEMELAALSIKAPETLPGTEKKMTAQDRTAWLTLQRRQNTRVAAAINRQESVAFLLDSIKITVETTKKRLEGVRAILALRTAQIEFLTE